MAMNAARFLQDYPEFKNTAAELIDKKIQSATKRINATVWADLTNEGIMILTAHLLSVSPEGDQSRLKPISPAGKENKVTIYQMEWERMKREVTLGVGRVA